jgi:hypothetical protein
LDAAFGPYDQIHPANLSLQPSFLLFASRQTATRYFKRLWTFLGSMDLSGGSMDLFCKLGLDVSKKLNGPIAARKPGSKLKIRMRQPQREPPMAHSEANNTSLFLYRRAKVVGAGNWDKDDCDVRFGAGTGPVVGRKPVFNCSLLSKLHRVTCMCLMNTMLFAFRECCRHAANTDGGVQATGLSCVKDYRRMPAVYKKIAKHSKKTFQKKSRTSLIHCVKWGIEQSMSDRVPTLTLRQL